MKILIVHNAYQQRGGEDVVVDAECALLRDAGHRVQLYRRSNDELRHMGKLASASAALWNAQPAREIDEVCADFRPHVIHVHNTFPLISPAFLRRVAQRGIALVQTLHNFRLICPQGMLLRGQAICEDCLGNLPWRAVTRRCYRDSTAQSAVVAGMLGLHRALGSYRDSVDQYIALNEFCRAKFIAGGLPAERLRVKPHFAAAPDAMDEDARSGGLFVGRLSAEKGLELLAQSLAESPSALKIIGHGPLEEMARSRFGSDYLGCQPRAQVTQAMQRAAYLVAPSICYETFGMNIIEAFACATPVIASGHGGYAELVHDGVTGLLFNPGDARDLAKKIAWAESHPAHMRRMGEAARHEYCMRYTPQKNYGLLMEIYEHAIEQRRRRMPAAAHGHGAWRQH